MMKRLSILIFLIMFLIGCSINSTKQSNAQQIPVELVHPIDGDTIKVRVNGVEESVRFLLVDTPETHHPVLGVQPYGPEASQFTAQMVENAHSLTIELGTTKRDKYGRLLAYVYADGQSVQIALLKAGLARVAYVFPPNTKYLDTFRAAEAEARQARKNIWSVDGYAQEDGFHPEVMPSSR